MKTTLTTSQAANELRKDDAANWTCNGATAMIQHLEQDDEEMELDVIAIRGDWTEYTTALEAVADLCGLSGLPDLPDLPDDDDDEAEAEALKMMESKTTVIQFQGGIIVQAF